jgi:hypothetical protein
MRTVGPPTGSTLRCEMGTFLECLPDVEIPVPVFDGYTRSFPLPSVVHEQHLTTILRRPLGGGKRYMRPLGAEIAKVED